MSSKRTHGRTPSFLLAKRSSFSSLMDTTVEAQPFECWMESSLTGAAPHSDEKRSVSEQRWTFTVSCSREKRELWTSIGTAHLSPTPFTHNSKSNTLDRYLSLDIQFRKDECLSVRIISISMATLSLPKVILLFVTDQLRNDAFDPAITPNLHNLSSTSTSFLNSYVSAPTCTPARAGLLTGKSPWNHGLLGSSFTVWCEELREDKLGVLWYWASIFGRSASASCHWFWYL
jgi:hypothetical protein